MALKASIIITAISIGLLVIYGADAAVGGGTEPGFLPFDNKVRGFGLGVPSIVLPIIAFFISRKELSKGLGAMIIISGILIAVGGATVLAITDPAKADAAGRNVAVEAGPLLAIGAFIIALGAIKIKKSSTKISAS